MFSITGSAIIENWYAPSIGAEKNPVEISRDPIVALLWRIFSYVSGIKDPLAMKLEVL